MAEQSLQLLENIGRNNDHCDIPILDDLFEKERFIPTDFYCENPNPSMCGKIIFDICKKCIAIYSFEKECHVIFFYHLGTLCFHECRIIDSIRRIFYLNIQIIGDDIVISTIFDTNNGYHIKQENVSLSFENDDDYTMVLIDCERIDDIQQCHEFPSILESTFALHLLLNLDIEFN